MMFTIVGPVGMLVSGSPANDARFRRASGESSAVGEMRAVVSVMMALFPDAGCRRLAGMLGLAKSTVQAHMNALRAEALAEVA